MPLIANKTVSVSFETTETVVHRSVRHTLHIKHANAVNVRQRTAGSQDDSFHSAIAPVLMIAQSFGVMPVLEISRATADQVKFQWRSLRTLLSVLYIVTGIWILIEATMATARRGFSSRTIVNLIFLSCTVASGYLFLILAQKWASVAVKWQQHENMFLKAPYFVYRWRLKHKIRIIATVILIAALAEHLLFYTSYVHNVNKKIEVCGLEVESIWKYFIITEYGYLFRRVNYNFYLSLLVGYINILFTFVWNYMDIFIIVISIGLSTRFNQLNQRIDAQPKEQKNELFWAEIRKDYVLLCELLAFVDQSVSSIIVLSCMNNLYFICFQLINIFKKLPYTINYIYFWYSLLYLIIRTAFVFFSAAAIADASKKPLVAIRSLPTSMWCTEIDRFNEHLRYETIALSGMKFFDLTRKMVLGMAATIVTYELVLMQYDEITSQKSSSNICD